MYTLKNLTGLVGAALAVSFLSLGPAQAGDAPATPSPERVSYSWLKKHVFKRCVYCHTDRPDLPYLLSHASTMSVVIPGDPDNSRLYQMVASGRMPLGPRLNDDKVKAIYDWIKQGAQDD